MYLIISVFLRMFYTQQEITEKLCRLSVNFAAYVQLENLDYKVPKVKTQAAKRAFWNFHQAARTAGFHTRRHWEQYFVDADGKPVDLATYNEIVSEGMIRYAKG